MDLTTIKNLTSMWFSKTHSVAFYGIESWRNGYLKTGVDFNESTDLAGSADADLADRVVSAIASFGVTGIRVNDIECGPVVTRVNLVLPRGVKIKAVTDLANDLAMQLKVKSVSFTEVSEKGVLALDMPAEKRKVVLPGNVHTAYMDGMTLPLELGVTVTGTAKAIDLAKAPHLLIAGQTGSGKSVCINSIICSLLRNVPLTDFELMLVDPKGVELNDYKNIPNVVNNEILVEPSESLDGLRWLCDEMERRYSVLTKYGFRNIKSYNEWVKTQPVGVDCVEKMRYVVCVVDEFADLMMTSGAELTTMVQRLAQKSRAVGIHLVLATQRPSVKVVTGDLKANLPCRIAFKVSSSTDSVTILGHGGAEKLLGMGDMILSNNDVDERLHGVYMDDKYISSYTGLVCNSTVNTIVRRYNYVAATETVMLGTEKTEIPSWLLETMNWCGERKLAAGTPKWVADLVRIHNEVWDISNMGNRLFTMGILLGRMARRYDIVEGMRKDIEEHINEDYRGNVRQPSGVFDNVVEMLVRLPKWVTIGLGFSNWVAAWNREIPVNPKCEYIRDYV